MNALAQPLRIGIVGAGSRGCLYAGALSAIAGVELVGVCDPRPEALQSAHQQFGVSVHESHSALLAAGLDAVIVATPDFAHVEPAVAALEAGCHILVEKPLATTVDDAETIAHSAERAERECMVAFENRWNPAFVNLHERLVAEELGDVVLQSARLNLTRAVPMNMLGWAHETSPVWFQMSHTVDLVIWLGGSRPIRVTAVGSHGYLDPTRRATLDAVQAVVEFADGTSATLEASWLLPDAMPSLADFKYEVIARRGAAFVDQLEQTLRVAGPRLVFPRTLISDRGTDPSGFPVWMVMQFVRDVSAGRPLRPNATDGVLVTRTLSAIERSIQAGVPVDMSEPAAAQGS